MAFFTFVTMVTIEQLYDWFLVSDGVSTDTRTVQPNQFFIALKGDNFNGNQYADEALLNGALFAVVDEEKYATSEQHILVEDGLSTLQELANFHRKLLGIPVIAITGSNGKTTTKELTHAVLSTTFHTYATNGNLNNHIGVPLTLLSLTPEHEIAIVEMGANHVGEIASLCEIAEPNFGLITNIGTAHIEGFGNQENIVKGKTELYDYLKHTNKQAVFVNADDAVLMAKSEGITQITYGRTSEYFTGAIEPNEPTLRLSLDDMEQSFTISTNLFGEYNFYNALAAGAVGKHFNVNMVDIAEAIEQYNPANHRSQILKQGVRTFIVDAYNANPSSMKLALEQFAQLSDTNKLAIIGSMLEMGNQEHEAHEEIVQLTETLQLPTYFIGEEFKASAPKDKWFATANDVKNQLDKSNATTILLKGSRGIRLEQLLK